MIHTKGPEKSQEDLQEGPEPKVCCKNHAGALISQTSRLIRRAMDTRIAREVSPELTGIRGLLLGEIIRAQQEDRPMYQRDVERWSRLRRSSVTAILQGMEQDGFITRSAVECDARLKLLRATPKGIACHDRIKSCIDRFEHDLQSGLSPEELEQMRAVLATLLKNAQSIIEEEVQ